MGRLPPGGKGNRWRDGGTQATDLVSWGYVVYNLVAGCSRSESGESMPMPSFQIRRAPASAGSSPDQVRMAAIQMDCLIGSVEENLAACAQATRLAAGEGATLVVFPEAILTGYCFSDPEEARSISLERDGRWARELATVAGRSDVSVAVGYLERTLTGLANAVSIIDGTGITAHYRKTHLPHLGGDRFVEPGENRFEVYEAAGLRVGLLVCYDASFPEASRLLALGGADIILLPTNWPEEAHCQGGLAPQRPGLRERDLLRLGQPDREGTGIRLSRSEPDLRSHRKHPGRGAPGRARGSSRGHRPCPGPEQEDRAPGGVLGGPDRPAPPRSLPAATRGRGRRVTLLGGHPVPADVEPRKPLGYSLAVLTAMVTAVAFIAAKPVLDYLDPLSFSISQFGLASLFSFAWILIRKRAYMVRAVTPGQWTFLVVIALLFLSAVYTMWIGLSRIPATAASLLNRLEILVTVFLGMALLGDRFSRKEAYGALVMFVGVVVLRYQAPSSFSAGFYMMLLSSMLFGLTEVLVKSRIHTIPPDVFAFARNFLVFVMFMIAALWRVAMEEGVWWKGLADWEGIQRGWPLIMTTALVGPFLARTLYMHCLKHLDLSKGPPSSTSPSRCSWPSTRHFCSTPCPAGGSGRGGLLILAGALMLVSWRQSVSWIRAKKEARRRGIP